MTNQLPLPSTEKDLATKHAVHRLLAETIKDLHELIFKIELPKTEMAKTVKIPVGTLHLIRNLAASASSSMQESPLKLGDTTKLDNIGRQLEDIRAHLVAPAPAMPPSPPLKGTYAAALAADIHLTHPPPPSPPFLTLALPPCPLCARPGTLCDLTLAQKSCDRPILTELSNRDLIDKIFTALCDVDCWFQERPCSLGSDGNEVVESLMLGIRAVGHHQSGDIWIATITEAEQDWLVDTVHRWLPRLLDRLFHMRKTYPVLVDNVPCAFDTALDSKDVEELVATNADYIKHPSAVQRIEPLPRKWGQTSRRETCVLIIHFTDPATANSCIDQYIAFQGQLLPRVKFIQRPPQCFKCHQEGHFARSCRWKLRCGLCVEGHDT